MYIILTGYLSRFRRSNGRCRYWIVLRWIRLGGIDQTQTPIHPQITKTKTFVVFFLVTHVDLIWLIESIRLWGEPMDRLPRFWSAVNLQGETPQKQGEKTIECIAIDMFIFAFICV